MTVNGSIGSRAGKGAVATLAIQALKFVTQIVSTVLLSRVLTPDDFGIYAFVLPIYVFGQLFQDIGFSQALIHADKFDDAKFSNVFWIGVGICVLIACAIAAICAPIAFRYARDDLTPQLVLAFAALIVVSGLGSTHTAILMRRLEFGYLAVLDVFSSLVGFVVAYVIAVAAPSAWVLYASLAVTALITTAGVILYAEWWPRQWNPAVSVRDMVSFGGGVFLFNLFNYFTRTIDSILIGLVWGTVQLGLYDRANKILLLPLQQVNIPLSRVLIPTLSRLKNEAERYQSIYLIAVFAVLLITQPFIVYATADSANLVVFTLGPQWLKVSPIFSLLGFAALYQPFSYTSGWLFTTQGRTREFWRWGVVNSVVTVAAVGIGLAWGAIGVAATYGARELFFRLPVLVVIVTRTGPVERSGVVRLLVATSIASAMTFAATRYAAGEMAHLPVLISVPADLGVAYVVYTAIILLFPDSRAMSISIARKLMSFVTRAA